MSVAKGYNCVTYLSALLHVCYAFERSFNKLFEERQL